MTNRHYTAGLPVRLYESESSVETVAAAHGLDPADVVDFSLNVNPYGPPTSAVVAATAALRRSHQYPDVRLRALREAVAARHGVRQDQILFGAGLDDVIKLLVHAWASEGDAVLVHLPTFPRYELEARLHGCEVVAVVGDPPWTVDTARLESALASRPIALAFLCTPNNPTGEKLDAGTVARLARASPGTIVVVDEALGDPLDPGLATGLRDAPNVVVLRTFSKAYGLAGMRVGYAIGPAPLLATVELGRPPFNVALPSEAAAIAALADDAFVRECRSRFRAEVERFESRIQRLPVYRVRGRHANMLLIELANRPMAPLQEALAARGIVVADAACFGGLDGRSAFRVSLRGPDANDRLAEALEALA
ncbi:MAG: histidinol-phosphate transaminase [Burkholderiales bacterium]